MPLFEDALSRTFGSNKGPLIYVLRDNVDVPTEVDDPLDPNCHYGQSGSMIEELILRLPHSGPIFKDDNKTVFLILVLSLPSSLSCVPRMVEVPIKL
jgi:hypothetical protein